MNESSMSIVFEFARTDTPEDPYAFRFKPQEYTLRTRHGGRKRVHLEWSDDLIGELGALREPYCDPGIVQRVGRILRTFLEPAGWSWHAQAIAQTAQQGRRVYLSIRSAAAELYALPWELLSLEGTGQFVGELPSVLVRYEWPETHTVPARAGSEPNTGRVLMAWSEAGGSVPHRKHADAIRMACQASGYDFDEDRDVLTDASVGKLADALERSARGDRPISVLHLLCHGGKAGQTNGIMFNSERERGSGVAVDALRLRQIVAPHASTLRLVVLMVCDSSNGGEFDSIAQSLHRAGIQAVIGSRFLFSVPGSSCVAETLYQSLLVQRKSLEDAFLDTRKQLARDASHLDWASLQLYARQADGEATHPLVVPSRERESGPSPPSVIGQIAFGLLDLPTLIKLRDMADREVSSRFAKELAISCVELVDPQLGLATDPNLLKRCRELLAAHALPQRGQFFEAKGDRLYVSFPDLKVAIKATVAFCEAVTEHNYHETRENQLIVRVGLHQASVLTDGTMVAGPSVGVTMRIAETARNGELLLSEQALRAAPKLTQALCQAVDAIEPDEVRGPIQLYEFLWRDNALIPAAVLVEETGEELALPEQDLISFGRLDSLPDGTVANDIVLTHADDKVQRAISRWHFELRRVKAGYVLRSISRLGTQVDDQVVAKDQELPVGIGSVICVAQQLRLVLKGHPESDSRRHAATMTVGFPG